LEPANFFDLFSDVLKLCKVHGVLNLKFESFKHFQIFFVSFKQLQSLLESFKHLQSLLESFKRLQSLLESFKRLQSLLESFQTPSKATRKLLQFPPTVPTPSHHSEIPPSNPIRFMPPTDEDEDKQ
jgi:cell shape-determining protein MreC